MIKNNSVTGCNECLAYANCFSCSLGERTDVISRLLRRDKFFKKGSHAFFQGERFGGIFVVKSGSFKTYLTDADGTSQVAGFHLPGELIGASGLYSGEFEVSAQALEGSLVCELPIERLDALLQEFSSFRVRLIELLAREVGQCLKISALSSFKADDKLSAFLKEFSDRLNSQGISSCEHQLPMSKGEIANFLGLAAETVSRSFSKKRDAY